MVTTKDKKIQEILSRGVVDFIDPEGVFKKKLQKKAQGEYQQDIIIKLGVDPTRPDIHLGHAVLLHKMRALQDLGCKVVFLVGDFTAQIGDPSGKDKTRPELAQKEIEENMQTYLDQIKKILKTEPKVFSWIRNSDWFVSPFDLSLPKDHKVTLAAKKGKESIDVPLDPQSIAGRALAFSETRMQKKVLKKNNIENVTILNILWTLKHISYGRLIQRDMFQERIKKGGELYMHEMLYPIFQGIDSYVLAKLYGSCDLEIGGTDQTFNMLVGRDVMRINKQEQQAVLSTSILPGTDGKEKMSKSLDNYIKINTPPEDMYGKIMSTPDDVLPEYFTLTTFTPQDDIEEIKKELLQKTKNPKDVKMRLAHEVVALYHGEAAAERAQEHFVSVFQKGNEPDKVVEVFVEKGTPLLDISKNLINAGLIQSKKELQRLISEGAVRVNNKQLKDANTPFNTSQTLKIGKTRFVRVVVS